MICFVLESYTTLDVNSSRKFKFVDSTNNEDIADELILCKECSVHLTSNENRKIYEAPVNTWPGFIWSVLSNESLVNKYGVKIWQFIPQQWRHWWLCSAFDYFPEEISIQNPPSYFVDKTIEMNEWDTDIESMSLARLQDTTNKHLMPCVLCPWGCSEFYHR